MAGEWARSLDVEVREAQLEGEAAEISRTYLQSINQSINTALCAIRAIRFHFTGFCSWMPLIVASLAM